jgi:hypothetical protein
MGDRANVVVKETRDGPGVWLYTHSGGTELPETLKAALARRLRWDDDAYLARIIFCEMVRGYENSEYGFGISTSECDCEGGRNIFVIVEEQKVVCQGKEWTFEEYVKQRKAQYPNYRDDE